MIIAWVSRIEEALGGDYEGHYLNDDSDRNQQTILIFGKDDILIYFMRFDESNYEEVMDRIFRYADSAIEYENGIIGFLLCYGTKLELWTVQRLKKQNVLDFCAEEALNAENLRSLLVDGISFRAEPERYTSEAGQVKSFLICPSPLFITNIT